MGDFRHKDFTDLVFTQSLFNVWCVIDVLVAHHIHQYADQQLWDLNLGHPCKGYLLNFNDTTLVEFWLSEWLGAECGKPSIYYKWF